MTTPFAANLRLVLKLLSMSAARLASELETDKSAVGRWLNGSVMPSAHNLGRLTALVAGRVEGFKALDWERSPESLVQMFGGDPSAIPAIGAPRPGLPLPIWDQMIATAAARGHAYEGFFRSTRPHPRLPRRFLHEYGMIRQDAIGLPKLHMGSAESRVEGWMMPLHGLLYCVAAEINSGTLQFGIFNGSGASRLEVFDGLTLIPGADMGRSPMATPMLCERVGDLSGRRDADDERFAALMLQTPLAPEGSIPEHIANHLVRDIGPLQLALGGDWLLSMTLLRSMTRGPDYESKPAGKNPFS